MSTLTEQGEQYILMPGAAKTTASSQGHGAQLLPSKDANRTSGQTTAGARNENFPQRAQNVLTCLLWYVGYSELRLDIATHERFYPSVHRPVYDCFVCILWHGNSGQPCPDALWEHQHVGSGTSCPLNPWGNIWLET